MGGVGGFLLSVTVLEHVLISVQHFVLHLLYEKYALLLCLIVCNI